MNGSLLALALLAQPTLAQDFNVSATVNRTQITLEEQVVLAVTVLVLRAFRKAGDA